APTGLYNGGQVYYTFPAFENPPGTDFWINQPVLQYGSAIYGVAGQDVQVGGQYWTLIAVHCHDNSAYGCGIGTPQTVQPGDVVHDSVLAYNCGAGQCAWLIFGRDSTNG